MVVTSGAHNYTHGEMNDVLKFTNDDLTAMMMMMMM